MRAEAERLSALRCTQFNIAELLAGLEEGGAEGGLGIAEDFLTVGDPGAFHAEIARIFGERLKLVGMPLNLGFFPIPRLKTATWHSPTSSTATPFSATTAKSPPSSRNATTSSPKAPTPTWGNSSTKSSSLSSPPTPRPQRKTRPSASSIASLPTPPNIPWPIKSNSFSISSADSSLNR